MQDINGNGRTPQSTAGYTYIDTDGPHPNTQYTIASTSNTTPIQVTWSGAVPFNDGDTIEIEGHATNVNANGVWPYQKIDSTHGLLVGSTPTAAGGATGIGLDWSINPILQVPEDLVDDVDANTVNPTFQGLFDLAPYMYRRMGAYSLIDVKARDDGAVFTTFSTTAVNAVTWTDLGVTAITGRRYLHYGDLLEISFFSALSCTASNTVAVAASLNNVGYGTLTASAIEFAPGTSGVIVPFHLRYRFVFGGGGFPDLGPYNITIQGLSAAGTPNIVLSGPQQLLVKHYRPNI